jgi:hypothetical protein
MIGTYPINDNNLLLGPANVYVALQGTQWPSDASITPDGMAVPPPLPWLPVGGTTGDVKVTGKPEYTDMDVDQLPIPPGTRQTGLSVTVATTLAEVTQSNLNLAMNNMGIYAQQLGYSTLDFYVPPTGGRPPYISLIVDGQAPASAIGMPMRRRWVIPKVLNKDGFGDIANSKKTQQGISVTWTVFYVSASVQFIHIVDAQQ